MAFDSAEYQRVVVRLENLGIMPDRPPGLENVKHALK